MARDIVIDLKCHHNPIFNMENIYNMNVNGISYWITLCDDCMRKRNARPNSTVGPKTERTAREHFRPDSGGIRFIGGTRHSIRRPGC